MEPETKEEKLARFSAKGRKVLEDGTWPEVMMVFGYLNKKVARRSKEEFAKLKEMFGEAGYANIALFIDMAVFDEEQQGSSMSFNLSTRRRLTPEEAQPTLENALLLFSSRDVLIGTRNGSQSAFDWFVNLSEAMKQMPVEGMQIYDKIFGEAIEFLKGPGQALTVGEMLQKAFSDEDFSKERSDSPFKQ